MSGEFVELENGCKSLTRLIAWPGLCCILFLPLHHSLQLLLAWCVVAALCFADVRHFSSALSNISMINDIFILIEATSQFLFYTPLAVHCCDG